MLYIYTYYQRPILFEWAVWGRTPTGKFWKVLSAINSPGVQQGLRILRRVSYWSRSSRWPEVISMLQEDESTLPQPEARRNLPCLSHGPWISAIPKGGTCWSGRRSLTNGRSCQCWSITNPSVSGSVWDFCSSNISGFCEIKCHEHISHISLHTASTLCITWRPRVEAWTCWACWTFGGGHACTTLMDQIPVVCAHDPCKRECAKVSP